MIRSELLASEPHTVSDSRDAQPYSIGIGELAVSLGTDVQRGLRSDQVDGLRKQYGLNELAAAIGPPWWRRLGHQVQGTVIWALIGAAVLSALIGNLLDASAILGIVVLNALIGFAQEEHAGRLLGALKQLSAPHANVIRDAIPKLIPVRDVVPGDLCSLEPGIRVPADARIIHDTELKMDEAALTGESLPVAKSSSVTLPDPTELAERSNMVHMGTMTSSGRGLALVTSTGMNTEIGQIAGMLPQQFQEPTPLERRLNHLGKALTLLVLGIVTLIFILEMIRGGSFLNTAMVSISLGVAAIPEGLPAVMTLSLAVGLQRLAKRHALIRRLPSVETLGSVTVICTDKTGTLTRNEMTVRAMLVGRRQYRITGAGYDSRGDFFEDDKLVEHKDTDLLDALQVGAWCNHARVVRSRNDRYDIFGDPTEAALLIAAAKAGLYLPNETETPVHEIPFDSERKIMSMVYTVDGRDAMYTKGAPEAVLNRCTQERLAGIVIPLTAQRREQILQIASNMASQALRVLGLAYGEFPATRSRNVHVESELVFVGLAGMVDPPREEAKAAVDRCREAGIRPILITGDHPATAAAIAVELGFPTSGGTAMSGSELDGMDDAELATRITEVSVYARVTAAHKLRIVRAWKSRGQVVAMTGDGVNDAPAIKAADIGIAMGTTGTDIAKEAADMVLIDDNFASIVHAVEEGRGIFDNIQKVVHYLLASNTSEILFMLAAALIGWPVPLLAIQILWINLITDSLPALALGTDTAEPDVMKRPPLPMRSAILGRRQGATILIHGILMTLAVMFGFWRTYRDLSAQLPAARTVAFSVLVFSQLFYSFACRSPKHVMPRLGLLSNVSLVAGICISILLQFAVVTSPLGNVLSTVALSATQWAAVLLLSLFPVTVIELAKLARSRK